SRSGTFWDSFGHAPPARISRAVSTGWTNYSLVKELPHSHGGAARLRRSARNIWRAIAAGRLKTRKIIFANRHLGARSVARKPSRRRNAAVLDFLRGASRRPRQRGKRRTREVLKAVHSS